MPFLAPAIPLLIKSVPMILGGVAAGGTAKVLGGGGSSSSSGGGGGTGDNQPVPINPIYPGLQESWGKFLESVMGKGATPYEGNLNFDWRNDTILPQVQGQWRASGPQGSDYLRWMTQDGSKPGSTDIGFFLQNAALPSILSHGHLGGAPGTAMNQMMTYGGAGQKGMNAMDMMLQYGAPSEAGRGLANMWQYGIASEQSGRPLINRAYGEPTAASNYLARFLEAQPYRAPGISPLNLTRATTRRA